MRTRWIFRFLWLALILLAVLSLLSGTVDIPPQAAFGILASRLGWEPTGWAAFQDVQATVFWNIRFPRVALACMVGAALGISGGSLQGLFRNSLADPGLIGVSAGAAMGAVIAITLGTLPFLSFLPPMFLLPVFAMLGGIISTTVVYQIARIGGRSHISTLLLAGIAINALSGALIGALIYLSSSEELRRFTFWTLGSLSRAEPSILLVAFLLIALPMIRLLFHSRALNAFLLGEAEAWHLGIDTHRLKREIIILNALMVGGAVAWCGLIGFVGLVVPHLVRLCTGPDHRHVLPGSALLGSVLLIGADLLARTINPPGEIPIGILTALLGAPFFLYLIARRKNQST